MPQDDPYSLKHYGVLGMHWGVRKAEDYGRAVGKTAVNSYVHPILTRRANNQSIASEKTIGARARRRMLYSKTSELQDLNSRTANLVEEKKAAKLKKKAARLEAKIKSIEGKKFISFDTKKNISSFERYARVVGQGSINAYMHPFLQDAAFRKSIASEKSFGTRLRRLMLYSNTNEIADMNRRAEQLFEAKKAAKINDLKK